MFSILPHLPVSAENCVSREYVIFNMKLAGIEIIDSGGGFINLAL
jgi:hypothetical protein